MLWRAPWLRRRLSLGGFAAWDVVSLYMSYNCIYLLRLGRWEGLSAGLLVILSTWLGTSYLIGRYSPVEGRDSRSYLWNFGRTMLAGIAVLVVFIGHSWAYQIVDAQTRFRGFLIPLVLCACLLSGFGQILRASFTNKPRKWILLGNKEEMSTIVKELSVESIELRSRSTILEDRRQIKDKMELCFGDRTGVAFGNTEKEDNGVTEKLLRLREKGEYVIPLVNWCERELQRIPPELIYSEWLVQAEGFTLRPGSTSWRIKRFGDVIGALALMTLTAPVVLICCLVIWLDDRGPVFYKQIRSGLYGRPICIWKLRSMRVDSESKGAQWASKSDPRVTRFGRFIRAMRVDELPQLISVINGDLSLIGPRPERPEIEEGLEHVIPNYRVRHWIRPGLSGWAQVCYPYGASVEDSRMKLSYDLYYLRNANMFLDILVTLKTIRLVANAKGASPAAPQLKRS